MYCRNFSDTGIWGILYWLVQILYLQATRKEKINSLTLHFNTYFEISLLCQKKDSYTDSVYSKETFGTLLTISQRFDFIKWKFNDFIFFGVDPLWLYKNMRSLTCLEARENVLLPILLLVFDTGSFIVLLYLPYSLRVGYSSARV